MELAERGEALVDQLAHLIAPYNTDLAEMLRKALPSKEVVLKYPALRDLKELTAKEYERTLKVMLRDIGKVLDQSFQKAEGDDDEEEEKLEPGDVDPESGELIPEPEEEEEEEPELGEEEEEQTKKAEVYDPTYRIAERDEAKYQKVRQVLKDHGYTDADFDDKEGVFYGWSVNELIDFARGLKDRT